MARQSDGISPEKWTKNGDLRGTPLQHGVAQPGIYDSGYSIWAK